MSIGGASSPENWITIDGMSVNHPARGPLATPLSMMFLKEIKVINGGYMPEYGRSNAGLIQAFSKSGSTTFQGSFFTSLSPGIMEGTRKIPPHPVQTIEVEHKELSLRDAGVELSGPILRDKLWFYTAYSPSLYRMKLDRYLNRRLYQAGPCPGFEAEGLQCNTEQIDPSTGVAQVQEIPGTRTGSFVDERNHQYIVKLTYAPREQDRLWLAISGVHTSAGGDGTYPAISSLNGTYEALAKQTKSSSTNIMLGWVSSFMNKTLLLDTLLGFSHIRGSELPADGSALGSNEGLAGLSQVHWLRSTGKLGMRKITEFEQSPEIEAACAPVPTYIDPSIDPGTAENPCPIASYIAGGPGFISEEAFNRIQAKISVSRIFQALGMHTVKAGLNIDHTSAELRKAYTGTVMFRESSSGRHFLDHRRYGYLIGPDQPLLLNSLDSQLSSTEIGGFIQDRWIFKDILTLNAGLRYDAQVITGSGGKTAMSLLSQWSPRIGVVYDPGQKGRSRIFANYARYYAAIPLHLAERAFSHEGSIQSVRYASGCNPSTNEGQESAGCTLRGANGNPDYSNAVQIETGGNPNQYWLVRKDGRNLAVDPDISSQSMDEFGAGAEYALFKGGLVGLHYTKRWLGTVIEDMGFDSNASGFLGNPGQGIASRIPAATRDYDALALYGIKTFSDRWLAQASYTLSYARGNYPGLFRPESGQFDPNTTSEFDMRPFLINRTGPLPIDRRHRIRVDGAKDFTVKPWLDIQVGATYRAQSGAPISVLGSHLTYGANEIFFIPRGSYGSTPWIHAFDTHLGMAVRVSNQSRLYIGMDVFNLLNFQAAAAVDQTLTAVPIADVPSEKLTATDLPVKNAKTNQYECPSGAQPGFCDSLVDGEAINPNWNNPTAYQAPRQFRFSARVTF